MPLSQHRGDLLLGHTNSLVADRLGHDDRDCTLAGERARREQARLRRGQGNIDDVILISKVGRTSLFLHHADDAEGDVVDPHRLAQRIRIIGEKIFDHGLSQDNHPRAALQVLGTDELPHHRIPVAHLHQFRRDAVHLGEALLPPHRNAAKLSQRRCYLDHIGHAQRVGQRLGIAHRQAGADTHHSRPARHGVLHLTGEDDEHVSAHVLELAGDVGLYTIAHRHQRDDRPDADDDAQHRQGSPQFVGRQGAEGQSHTLQDAHAPAPPPAATRGSVTASSLVTCPS